MPEISRFYGIIIKMFFNEHNPAHIHAVYGNYQALLDINTFAIISGKLPPRAFGLVTEWMMLHKNELLSFWEKAKNHETLGKIKPLK